MLTYPAFLVACTQRLLREVRCERAVCASASPSTRKLARRLRRTHHANLDRAPVRYFIPARGATASSDPAAARPACDLNTVLLECIVFGVGVRIGWRPCLGEWMSIISYHSTCVIIVLCVSCMPGSRHMKRYVGPTTCACGAGGNADRSQDGADSWEFTLIANTSVCVVAPRRRSAHVSKCNPSAAERFSRVLRFATLALGPAALSGM